MEQNACLKEHKLFKQNIKYLQFFSSLRPTMVARHCFMLKCSRLSQVLHPRIQNEIDQYGSETVGTGRCMSEEALQPGRRRVKRSVRGFTLVGGERRASISSSICARSTALTALQTHVVLHSLSQTWTVKLHERVIRSSFTEDDHVLVEGLLK